MRDISVIFWDIGGVLLSNAWDHAGRRAAAEQFGLDPAELERRHEEAADAFETGRLTEAEYLDRTVFYAPRAFSKESFGSFMRGRSVAFPDGLAAAQAVRRGGRYLMVALNNESTALNEYRIATFRLRELCDVFLSSCYTGRRKPDPDAYRHALDLTQKPAEESLLVDDRLDNVKAADRLGFRTVWVRDPGRLRDDLGAVGVVVG